VTLLELVDSAFDRTHVERAEILERVLAAWPSTYNFKPVQCRLLEWALTRNTQHVVRRR